MRTEKMTDLSTFDANIPSNPKNGIFGLPFSEEGARLVILPGVGHDLPAPLWPDIAREVRQLADQAHVPSA